MEIGKIEHKFMKPQVALFNFR